MLFKEKITKLRLDRKITQKGLAEKSGLKPAHIHQIEAGLRTKIYLETACKLAISLGVSLDEMIENTEFERRPE